MGSSFCFFSVLLGLFHGFLVLVFSAPLFFSPDSLPPFYRSVLSAWRACKGFLTASTLGLGSGIDFCPVSAMSMKSAYLFLLSENAVSPHCEEKFFLLFGSLYWSCTWRQLFFFDLDCPVIDLQGREACWFWVCSCRVSFTFVLSLSSGCQCSVVALVSRLMSCLWFLGFLFIC